MGKPLTVDRAKKLASALSGRDSMFSGHGAVRVYVADDRLVFELVEKVRNTGEAASYVTWCYGKVLSAHSLCLSVTDEARAVAHYDGFCSNHGFGFEVGDSINFPSASATSGWRVGRVLSVGPRRVEVAGRFKHGGRFTKKVVKGDLRSHGRRVEAARA